MDPTNGSSLVKCFSREQQRLCGSDLEEILFKIFFPPICVFGIIGNLLNLMVFFSSAMKSRAKSLLSCLAICDICFLLLMVPHSLANFSLFAYSYQFRWYYLTSKIHLITLANWNSATAIWIIIAICAERVMGIRDPFGLRDHWPCSCITFYVVFIVILAGCLTFYNHFSYICFVKDYCYHTQVMAQCFDVTRQNWLHVDSSNKLSEFHQSYVKWSIVLNAVFAVFIPTVLLIVLNIALVSYIKRRSFVVYQKLTNRKNIRKIHSGHRYQQYSAADSTHAEQVTVQKTEHRVAVTVCAIVTSFTLTQGPSAVVSSVSSILSRRVPNVHSDLDVWWHQMHTVASFLVIIGKAMNFLLFCLSSHSFRRHLIQMLCARIDRQRSAQQHTTFTGYNAG